MRITMIGTGYVGLVTAACFAEMGNQVACVDVDQVKIANLRKGILPIYEPGLEAVVSRNAAAGRLRFHDTLADAMDGQLYFIAVGTPPSEDGSADLRHVLTVARELGERLSQEAIVVTKSTVPVGTADRVRETLTTALAARGQSLTVDLVSNPEFLKEGDALSDFMRPDRIVVGCESDHAREVLRELYAPFMRNHERILFMSIRAAEMTKYAANAMLATKISFMNEISAVCEGLEIDVESVRIGIGSDSRIGYSFIYPGCGYGGSCFPKDVKALVHTARGAGVEPLVLDAVEERNRRQKGVLFEHIQAYYGLRLDGLVFAVWGLAFKPGTDDVREAPSRVLIDSLIRAGARVQAYDPVAGEAARRDFPAEWFESGALTLASDQYGALEGAEALALVTEWKPFRHPDLALMKSRLRSPWIFDGRNQYDPALMREAGFRYWGIGRS